MIEFTPGQSANVAHQAIVSSLKTQKKAERCSVLWFAEIIKRKLYRELGYASVRHYAMEKLGFSKSQFYVFQNLCLKLEELPCLKKEIESGELDYTKAQALLPVVDKTNEREWVDKARGKSRRELQGIVKAARKESLKVSADQKSGQSSLIDVPRKQPVAAVPVIVSMKMSPSQFARYEALWEKVRKQRMASADRVEVLLEIMGAYVLENQSVEGLEIGPANNDDTKKSSRLDSASVNKPPVQIHIHQCPDCESAAIQTSKGELKISKAEYERALCDCTISQSNKRNTTSIPPSARRKVLEKARYKCQRPGCDHTRFLEVHHIVPRSHGGTNDITNLTCLCSACHKFVHESKSGGINLLVKELSAVYRWGSNCFMNR